METLLASIVTEVTPILNTLLFAVLGIVGTWLGIQAKALMARMESSQKMKEMREALEINEKIVETSVDYAEQIGSHLAGTEKFKLAKEKAYQIMAGWGITISDVEIEALIEQVVNGYNKEESKLVVGIETIEHETEVEEGVE